MRHLVEMVIVVFAAVIGTRSASAAPTVAIPGNYSVVPLAMNVIAIGYDTGKSTLYGISTQSGSTRLFGEIDPETGKYVGTPITLSIEDFESGVSLTADPYGHVVYTGEDDGIVGINELTGKSTFYKAPTGLLDFRFDFLSSQIIGFSSSGVQTVALPSGAETQLTALPTTATALGALVAVDSIHHLFAVEESANPETNTLDLISESTGAISRYALPARLIGLTYDYSSAGFVGLTASPNELVYITLNGSNAVFTRIATLAGTFAASAISALDSNDRYFFIQVSGTTQFLVATDIAANRAWYGESYKGEAYTAYNMWMYSAGYAAGQRNASSSASQPSIAVLDFGGPAHSKAGEGATGFGNFLTTVEVSKAATEWAIGFLTGLGPNTSRQAVLVLGTNNSTSHVGTTSAGAAWAKMISLTQAAVNALAGGSQISVQGGMDIEIDYSLPTAVSTWKSGYGSNRYLDFGDAAGCPSKGPLVPKPGAPCIGQKFTWYQDDIVTLAGNAVVPEIYSVSLSKPSVAPGEWNQLSLYNLANYKLTLDIVAPISQLTACLYSYDPTSCDNLDGTPTQSLMEFSQGLNVLQTPGPGPDIQHRLQ